MPIHVPAFAGTHCTYPVRDGQTEFTCVAGYIWRWFTHLLKSQVSNNWAWHQKKHLITRKALGERRPLPSIESNVNENFKVIQNPGFLPDHPQNWITCKFAIPNIPSKLQEDPSITFRVILLTHRQTDRQTKSGKNITSLSEVIKIITKTFFLLSLSCLSSL